MAEEGEWNAKGATLSDATAVREYGVSREFILKGIRAGKLEYRESSMWGNPCIKLFRSQLEKYVVEQLGAKYLLHSQTQAELQRVKKEIGSLKKKLTTLQKRKSELEAMIGESQPQ